MLVLQNRGESYMSFAASILSWLESYCPCGASRLELSGHKPSKAPSTGDVAAWACVDQDQSREAMVVIQETAVTRPGGLSEQCLLLMVLDHELMLNLNMIFLKYPVAR